MISVLIRRELMDVTISRNQEEELTYTTQEGANSKSGNHISFVKHGILIIFAETNIN